jgi:plasmid stability protein
MSSQEIVQSSEQLVIKLDHDLIEKLRRSASSHDRSIDEEVREILRDAVESEKVKPVGLGTRLAARFRGIGLEEEIPELRGCPAEPADFDNL